MNHMGAGGMNGGPSMDMGMPYMPGPIMGGGGPPNMGGPMGGGPPNMGPYPMMYNGTPVGMQPHMMEPYPMMVSHSPPRRLVEKRKPYYRTRTVSRRFFLCFFFPIGF